MDVAGPKLDGPLEQIVERTHDRRAAGKITQAFDVVIRLLRRCPHAIVGVRIVGVDPLVEHGRDILERSDRDLDRRAEHKFGGANCSGVRKDRRPQQVAAARCREGRIVDLPEEAAGEAIETGRAGEQLRQAQLGHAPVVGNLSANSAAERSVAFHNPP